MSPLRALLCDLDDTLLGNSMESFIPAYFGALTGHLAHLVDPRRLATQLVAATRQMQDDTDGGATNAERFAAAFYPALEVDRSLLENEIATFYAEVFPTLSRLTTRRPQALQLVQWCEDNGLQVVVATNPLFPRVAIEERLRWAGVAADRHSFSLVTCAENMHATKARPEYYLEILRRIGRQPDECLMVGDDWWGDMVHASLVGIPVYWIADAGAEPPSDHATPIAKGDLRAFWSWLQASVPGR